MIALLELAGLSSALARRIAPLAWVLAAVLLVGLLAGLWAWLDARNDKAAVALDRAQANAAFQERQRDAERRAGAAKSMRDEKEAESHARLQDTIRNADANGSSAADDVWHNGLWD